MNFDAFTYDFFHIWIPPLVYSSMYHGKPINHDSINDHNHILNLSGGSIQQQKYAVFGLLLVCMAAPCGMLLDNE